jgi:hypothetical protein
MTRMNRLAVIYSCGFAALTGQEVPAQWVEALAQVETGGVARRGDRGRAAGLFQFHRGAWSDVSRIRRNHGLVTHPYSAAWDDGVAWIYARTWLSLNRTRLLQALNRNPTPAEVYLAHNLGFEGFSRLGFDIDRAAAWRRDAALRFETIALSKDKTK